MDANEARKIEQEISNFLTQHFQIDGRNFYDRLQYMGVASRVKEEARKSLLDDLHEFRKLRNDVVHNDDKAIRDLYDRIWERLLRLAVPERADVPFLIINKNSGRCLDVPHGVENGKIQQWERHGGKNQQWILRETEDRSIIIISAMSGKCLEIESSSLDKPAWLQVWQYNGGANQKFTFRQLEDGAYSITVKHSNLVLDVWGCNSENEALITQWDWHGGNNQRWYVIPNF
jgi:hypothetical protein